MNTRTTYNLVSLVWHPNSTERMHVGLWMNNGHSVMFDYNPDRLEVAGKLLDAGELRSVKAVLQSLKTALSLKAQTSNIDLADDWNESKMAYLNRYSNNLLVIEPTTPISIELNDENFRKLCQRYLGMVHESSQVKKVRLEKRMRTYLSDQLIDRTSLDARLDTTDLKGLLYPITIPSLGINEVPFVCEILDFEGRIDAVSNRIGDLLNLKEAFIQNSFQHATYFAIGNEPSKKNSALHQVWSTLHNARWIQLVPEEEKQRIVEYAVEHNVQPWFNNEA